MAEPAGAAQTMPVPLPRRTRRLAGHLRRWGPYWVVAIALLAASQMLWRWQTWNVRVLLAGTGAGTP